MKVKIVENIRLISIWEAHKPKDSYVGFHSHNYHELVYYPHGSGKTTIGGQVYSFADQCYALIPPHVSHDEYHQLDGEVICLEFTGAAELPPRFGADPLGAVYRILRDLLREARLQEYGYQDMMGIKLAELCLRLQRSGNCVPEEKNFEYVINYIRENYQQKILLSDCARQMNLSYDYFQHKFKAITGASPRQFLIRQRLGASLRMLEEGRASCSEIAFRCGFSTSAQFSALFKREYGQTPLQFRKKHT